MTGRSKSKGVYFRDGTAYIRYQDEHGADVRESTKQRSTKIAQDIREPDCDRAVSSEASQEGEQNGTPTGTLRGRRVTETQDASQRLARRRVNGGVDGARTRDLRRDRPAF